MDNTEKFEKLKELSGKRQLLFKELCQKCMASRLEPGRESQFLTPEKLEECEHIRKEIGRIDKEIDEL